jgi:hypothetical protein
MLPGEPEFMIRRNVPSRLNASQTPMKPDNTEKFDFNVNSVSASLIIQNPKTILNDYSRPAKNSCEIVANGSDLNDFAESCDSV